MASKLLNWAIVFLVLALVVAIIGVNLLGVSSQWLVIILIVLAIISILMGRHRRWL